MYLALLCHIPLTAGTCYNPYANAILSCQTLMLTATANHLVRVDTHCTGYTARQFSHPARHLLGWQQALLLCSQTTDVQQLSRPPQQVPEQLGGPYFIRHTLSFCANISRWHAAELLATSMRLVARSYGTAVAHIAAEQANHPECKSPRMHQLLRTSTYTTPSTPH
jgi:hypothetical protein